MKKHIEHDRTNHQFIRVVIASMITGAVLIIVIKYMMN